MSFSADWLALRTDADRRARNSGLGQQLAERFRNNPPPLRVLDLGAGTGANMAATAPLLPAGKHWVLVDQDADLLARAIAPHDATMERRVADLAGDLRPLFDPTPHLVTASAFFDLCGADWIGRLVREVVRVRAAFYSVLTYDGREIWNPPHPLDQAVLAAFHADQRRDKGLGPALGPDATDHLAGRFRAAGYLVEVAASDWHLEAERDSRLIEALARGSADAVAPALGNAAASEWHRARGAASSVTIGHQDLLALPPVG